MYYLLTCPECQREALVPGTTDQVTLKCPSCGHVLELAPDDHPAEGIPTWQSISTNELQLAEAESTDELQTTASSGPKSNWKGFEPITHEQFERMKRKQRSPLWTMLQVVLGGLAAFPIALGILWYALDRDIMNAGPTIAKYVPWIVPKKFQGDVGIEDLDFRSSSFDRQSERKSGLPPPGSSTDLSDATGGDVNGADAPTRLDSNVPTPDQSMGDTTTTRIEAPRSANKLTQADVEQRYPFTRGLFATIKSWRVNLLTWRNRNDDPNANVRQIAQGIYGDMCDIAQVLTFFNGESRSFRFVRDGMLYPAREVKNNADLQNLVQQGASATLKREQADPPARREFPLAMVLQISSAELDDGVWKIEGTTPEPLELPATFICQIPDYLAPRLTAGQRLLTLGIARFQPEPQGLESQGEPVQAGLQYEVNFLFSMGAGSGDSLGTVDQTPMNKVDSPEEADEPSAK
ncbi:MAG TPA: hypothetical protein DDW52_01970 [Planctomycetaceae bacterium]|nr:hypothetical protein [Planctomycetaceae bacterium]